jgi:hypothetical protein
MAQTVWPQCESTKKTSLWRTTKFKYEKPSFQLLHCFQRAKTQIGLTKFGMPGALVHLPAIRAVFWRGNALLYFSLCESREVVCARAQLFTNARAVSVNNSRNSNCPDAGRGLPQSPPAALSS